MKNNLVFLTALKSKEDFFTKRHNDYSWMEYSKKTWKYWCKKNNCNFYIFEKPIEQDFFAHRPNFQRWFKILEMIDDYDQILSVDASIMVKWDAPSFFDVSEHKWTCLKSRENMKWVWESASGYQSMFPEVKFDVKKYFNSGFIVFNKKHKEVLQKFKDFYYKNHDKIRKYQEEVVKRGTEQPILNYFIQMNKIDIKLLNIKWGINHLYRWQVLNGNWQLAQLNPNNNEHRIPFFIKYFNTWIFSGFPDRGETRNNLMKQTWDIVGENYE